MKGGGGGVVVFKPKKNTCLGENEYFLEELSIIFQFMSA